MTLILSLRPYPNFSIKKTVPYIVENEQESSDVARLLSEAMGMTGPEFHPREHE